MIVTDHQKCDEIAHAFNLSTDRKYFKAVKSGTRALPTVTFNSRTSMVKLTYFPQGERFVVSFSKVTCAFGDYMISAYSALSTVLAAMKAAGMENAAPLDAKDGVLRLQFDPRTKESYVEIALTDDDWRDYGELSFKGITL